VKTLSDEFIEKVSCKCHDNGEDTYGCFTIYSRSPIHMSSQVFLRSLIKVNTKYAIVCIDDDSITLSQIEGFELDIVFTEKIYFKDIKDIKVVSEVIGGKIIILKTADNKYKFKLPNKTKIFNNIEHRENFLNKLKLKMNM